MKKLLSAVGLLILTCTLTSAQEYSPFRSKHQPRHPQHQQQRPYVCSPEWKPVCARTRQNIVVRYSNSCFAEQDSALVIGPEEECVQATCSALYEPVCARIIYERKEGKETLIDRDTAKSRPPGTLIFANKAYFNDCAARQIGLGTPLASYNDSKSRYTESKFVKGAYDIKSVCPSACSGKIDLVCARDDQGKERLYANRCSAILEGAVFIHPGVCAGQTGHFRR